MTARGSSLEAVSMGVPLPEAPSWLADEQVHLRAHRTVLVLCVAIAVVSVLLHVTDDRQGLAFGSRSAGPLPGMCLSRSIAHIDCPGCGITRSFVATAHGDLALAFALHRLGPPLFLLILLQIPLRAYALIRRIARPIGPERLLGGRAMAIVIVAALLANWGVNLATGAAFH